MNIKDRTEGITLVALSITIIVLLILAGIGVYSGTEVIKKAKLEGLKTDMLLIKAKAREYVEDADFKMGINPTDEKKIEVRNNVYVENAKLEKAELDDISRFGITDDTTCYWLTSEAKNNWGLDNMELADDERYLIKFDEENLTVEVYNTNGYNGKYSLTEIEQIEE
jgi:Tfp pilus assembly protein PilE